MITQPTSWVYSRSVVIPDDPPTMRLPALRSPPSVGRGWEWVQERSGVGLVVGWVFYSTSFICYYGQSREFNQQLLGTDILKVHCGFEILSFALHRDNLTIAETAVLNVASHFQR